MTQLFHLFTFLLLFLFTFGNAQAPITKQIYFDSDQDTISLGEQNKLFNIVSNLASNPSSYRVHLIGHTDNQGSLVYNQDLSKRRAETIQNALVVYGFIADQISIAYKAYLSPLDKSNNETARAKNRRVDLILESFSGNVSNTFYLIDTNVESELSYTRSKTRISIPPEAFIYPDGKVAEGEVLISYREFQDYADFMMSDLPMNFNWEGEKAYFNSTGMFEIKAYDLENNPLQLAPNKSATIDFEQQQILEGTEFWKFDEDNNEWTSGNPYVKYEEGEMIRVRTGTRNEKIGAIDLRLPNKYMFGTEMDTIGRLQDAHALLREVIESVSEYRNAYVPQLDVNRFKHRTEGKYVSGNYAGTEYIGHLSFPEVYENPEYYNIQLKTIDTTNSKKVRFTIENLSDKNPELASLEGVVWQFNRKQFLKENNTDVFEKRYAHIRIRKGEKGRYKIRLKYKNQLTELEAQPVVVPQEEEETYNIEERYSIYIKRYQAQRKEFDEALKDQLEEALFLWPCVQLLLPREIPADEAMLNAIKPALRSRENNSDYWVTLFPPNNRDNKLEHIPGYTFLRDGARFFKSQLLGNSLDDTEWREKITEFDSTVNGEIPIYAETYRLFENPVPVLVLEGLGIFNLDVLKRFKEEKKIIARFETENKEELVILKTEIINHRLNGLLRFNSAEIYMDLGSPNTIILQAANGKVYYLSPDDIDQNQIRDQTSYTFLMKELEDYKARPEAIRDLLAGG
jgi:hypothetical protein